jgi:phosphoglycolate phosphatase
MESKYRKIFFDLDGTLSDSYTGIENGIRFALQKIGMRDICETEIKALIGIPLHQSLQKYFSNDAESIYRTVEYFREYYADSGVKESELYPGIQDLLQELSSVTQLFVITAKPTLYATKLLTHHNVAAFFTDILGCPMNGGNFSKASVMRSIPDLSLSIIIGDKQQDIAAGKELGIETGGILYGYGTKQEIFNAYPDHIIDSVPALKDVLIY